MLAGVIERKAPPKPKMTIDRMYISGLMAKVKTRIPRKTMFAPIIDAARRPFVSE